MTCDAVEGCTLVSPEGSHAWWGGLQRARHELERGYAWHGWTCKEGSAYGWDHRSLLQK
jgi:hypothetical protein